MITLTYDQPPKACDIFVCRIGPSEEIFDYTFLENEQEILFKIECEDGTFLVLKVIYPTEEHER